jgi:oligopeptide transport system substrate-binding protein
VDVVNLLQFDNRTDPYTLWQEGSLDIAPVPATVTAEDRQDLGGQLRHVPVPELFYLGFNFDSPVFRTPEMRRAFAAAIDTQALIDEVYDGLGFPMRHLTPPGVAGGLSFDVVGTGYSPDYARREFAAAGLHSCRLMTPVTLMVTTSDEALQQAEALQQMWRQELGCDEDVVQIIQVQFGTLLANTRQDAAALRPDMWILGWSAYYPDAYNWLTTILHCQESENRPRRLCSSVDNVLDDAAATPDLAEQAELYRTAENEFFGEDGLQPVVPLFLRGRYEVAQIWVVYTPTAVGGARFDTYEVDVDLRALERGE